MPKINIILDSQILSSLMACGRMTDYKFNQDLQSKGGKSVSLEMGSIVHTYLEHKYKAQIGGMKKGEAIAFGMTAAIDYAKSDEVTNSTEADVNLALDTCILYENYYKNDPWIPLEVEVVKGKQIYEDERMRVIWKAKFDLIADTAQLVIPVDHKTMKQRRDSINLNNQFTGQCVLLESRVMFVNKIGFQKSLEPKDRFSRAPVNFTKARLDEWTNQIVPYWANKLIEYSSTGYWPPNFTHCENKYGYCSFRQVCEANPNMRNELIETEYVKGKKWDI